MKKGYIIIFILLTLTNAFISGTIVSFFETKNGVDLTFYAALLRPQAWVVFALLYCVELIFFLAHKNLSSSVVDSANLENSHWQSHRELKKNFKRTMYSKLNKISYDGLPIWAEAVKKGSDILIYLTKAIHSIVIGSTTTGKTTSVINPSIQILSSLKNRPSLVISDPKGELFALHSGILTEKGYNIKTVNLRDPYSSIQWNPLAPLYDKTLAAFITRPQADRGKYFVNDIMYDTFDEADEAAKIISQSLRDEVFEELNDIMSTLCPIPNDKDQMWSKGAKNLFFAFILALLEDIESSCCEKSDVCFYNLYRNMTDYCKGDFIELRKFFAMRDDSCRSKALAAQVLETADVTMKGYATNVFDYITMFADSALSYMTSENELDFKDFDERPTALFLMIPDERDTRHRLATMLINQAYKDLIAKANENFTNGFTNEPTLKRAVHFILDEFGNLPKLHKLDGIITAGRSRKIYFMMVLQSYSQLYDKYGKETAETVIGNAIVQYYIGTNDDNTKESFSKRCGNYTVSAKSLSSGKGSQPANQTFSAQQRPLIYPSELSTLNNENNNGNSVVTVLGYYPVMSKLTRSYNCPIYSLGKKAENTTKQTYFDESLIHYDIRKRRIVMEAAFELKNEVIQSASPVIVQQKQAVKSDLDFLQRIIPGFSITTQEKINDALELELIKAKAVGNRIRIAAIVEAKLRVKEFFRMRERA